MREKKIELGIAVALVLLVLGIFLLIAQNNTKSFNFYQEALKDFNNGNYQNSYYLFSKVSFTSKLKPFAIYRQAMCAKELGDKKAEIKQYQLLSNNYTKNVLSIRSRYYVAQMLVENNPKLAKKYFKRIIKKYPNSEYATASEYYLGILALNEYQNNPKLIFSASVKNNIEKSFRHYLQKAPQGKQALNVITNWLKIDKEISPDDYLLMANTYYLFEDYENANKLLGNTDENESWVLWAKTAYAQKQYGKAQSIIEQGLRHAQNITSDDIKAVTDLYILTSANKTEAIDFLYNISKPKDYIWSVKCEIAPSQYQFGCYKQLYLSYPNSTYSTQAMANLFFGEIKAKNYKNAREIGEDFLEKFPKSKLKPFVIFWLGKIEEHEKHYQLSEEYFQQVIHEYPDNYYAYRSYLALKHYKHSILNNKIKEKPVVYPYANISEKDVVFALAKLQDYDILDLISNDIFVKSWIFYKKGDYSHSMLLARDAMEKINPKPNKSDLRWRLVYPENYYDKIKKYALNNNPILIMALIREESYFNKDAQSSVGASGLMQLMPSTAYEITHTNFDLHNPDLNIKAGNVYYGNLRHKLNDKDVLAIAAYNGGIGSVSKWTTDLNYTDVDEFIEQIPYPETKNYVKKVFRSYWNYLRIYTNN